MRTDLAIIDDFDAACQMLTPLGRYVLGNASLPIHASILTYAKKRGTRIIDHREFQHWFEQHLRGETWYSLDPLLAAIPQTRSHVRSLRVSRMLKDGKWSVSIDNFRAEYLASDSPVSLVDDVAVTAKTLIGAIDHLGQTGFQVERVLVCASMHYADALVAHKYPYIHFQQYLSGSWVCVHIRDACPYLPFSGRPAQDRPPIICDAGTIDIREPTAALNLRGPWSAIFSDFSVMHAVVQARVAVARELSHYLQRPALVGDLPLLGNSVTIPAYSRQSISPTTKLADVA